MSFRVVAYTVSDGRVDIVVSVVSGVVTSIVNSIVNSIVIVVDVDVVGVPVVLVVLLYI